MEKFLWIYFFLFFAVWAPLEERKRESRKVNENKGPGLALVSGASPLLSSFDLAKSVSSEEVCSYQRLV